MSITTLKKKSNAKYNNNSVGYAHFSINGITRNQGYIGRDSLGRTILKTPMKNNVPKGYGGCNGTYEVKIVNPADTCSIEYEAERTVKSSVLSSYAAMKRAYPFISESQTFIRTFSQSEYIERLKNQYIYQIYLYNKTHSTVPANVAVDPNIAKLIYSKTNYNNINNCRGITKFVGSVDESEYLNNKKFNCLNNLQTNYIHYEQTPLPNN